MGAKRIIEVLRARTTLEGAGVKLQRGFANAEVPRFDPFLLFDDFSSPTPQDYLAGFPMHPHRGIETVTYILHGDVRHKDSIGNSGIIGKGDVQWMTAGSGIIHEEMPEGMDGIKGFQLWVNLPRKDKMMHPRYQDVRSKTIPILTYEKHAKIKVITGSVAGVHGPVEDIMASPLYLDIELEREKIFQFPVSEGHTTFVYIIDGSLGGIDEGGVCYSKGMILLFSQKGDSVSLRAGSSDARFLFVGGKPLFEPVAWYGPIVMNSHEELREAFDELGRGTFIR